MIYPVNGESLALAAAAIRAGGLAAFPTETVYGLGGDAFNPLALAAIFEVKGRPRFDPLIVHIAGLLTLEEVADLSRLDSRAREQVERLAASCWPGPLTLVLPKRESVPDLATAGLSTVAVRFPAHPAARELIRLSTGAVAAPSANRFGCLSPTRAEHVAEQLGGRVDIILDGGSSGVGLESTVLDMSAFPPRILRPGGLAREALERILGPLPPAGPPDASGPQVAPDKLRTPGELRSPELRSPGMLSSHYAPRTPLYLHGPGAIPPWEKDSGWLFFSAQSRDRWHPGRGAEPRGAVEVLSREGDSREAAARLFEALHRLDRLGLRRIHAELAPPQGLGEAINDRLGRAAVH
ncbi:MAG: threonylcarbamoyl-AMP synthase [Treponema sp.]|jgi:L-threonylcarbamoyladenylate synthase|nr:threonylcarbamoyl-AMP synthase [Treponema sp.]